MLKQLIVFVFFLSLVSCNKEESPIPGIYTGTATALKNGEEWSAFTYYEEIKSEPLKFVLRGAVYNNEGLSSETFGIGRVEANMDRQEITSPDTQNSFSLLSSWYSTLIDDGDVLGDIYSLDTTAVNNFIQITNYNSAKAEIEGVFNVSFILTRASNDPDNSPPQNLEFTNAKFNAKVQREWFE